MNTKLRMLTMLLTMSLVLSLTGCIGFGDPLDAEDQEKINQQIREAIEKTFPLPEQVVIKTHVGDDLRFTTDLTLTRWSPSIAMPTSKKATRRVETARSRTESATLLFTKDGDKDVSLEITAKEKGCEVHIALKDR